MAGLFTWVARGRRPDTSALGAATIALTLAAGSAIPAGCTAVIVGAEGRTRRAPDGARVTLAKGESAWAFHPGPYVADLTPFAAAPEIGLRVTFAIDCPDPHMAQQRFDLFLASEARERLDLAGFTAALETAVQHELALGNLELPPCTALREWNAFRAGFNQLLYTRFGVSVDDCVPVDLGAQRDYAAMLLARAAQQPAADHSAPQALAAAPPDRHTAAADARALRRLFLELPCVMCGLRLAGIPPGQQLFRQQQALLQRLDLVSLAVNSMPALELAAPGQPLDARQQARRIRHSARAARALDEAWSLLARLQHAGGTQPAAWAALFDDADRIVANLEHDVAARCAVAESEAA